MHALPRIEEILNALTGNTFFSTMDMKAGHHQMDISEDHNKTTAVTVGFYENKRMPMPFWLTSSSATYQRSMDKPSEIWT